MRILMFSDLHHWGASSDIWPSSCQFQEYRKLFKLTTFPCLSTASLGSLRLTCLWPRLSCKPWDGCGHADLLSLWLAHCLAQLAWSKSAMMASLVSFCQPCSFLPGAFPSCTSVPAQAVSIYPMELEVLRASLPEPSHVCS